MNIQNSPVLWLLKFNISWQAQVMKFILMRYKLFMLFVLILLSPTFSYLISIITLPTKNLIAASVPYKICLISLLTYQGLGIIWVGLQQAVFSKQPWSQYLLSLPYTRIQKILLEALILFVADAVLWVPLFISCYVEMTSHLKGVNYFLIAVKCFTVILFTISIQLIFKRLLCKIAQHKSKPKTKNHKLKFEIFFPFIRIQVKNILIENISQIMIPIFSLIVTVLFSICIVKYSQTNLHLKQIIAAILFINTLILSNVFARLDTQRKRFSNYLSSLPLSHSKIFNSDMAIVSVFLLAVNSIVLLVMSKFTVSQFAIMESIPVFFLAATYIPQIKYKKFGFFISLGLMILFIGITYLLFTITK